MKLILLPAALASLHVVHAHGINPEHLHNKRQETTTTASSSVAAATGSSSAAVTGSGSASSAAAPAAATGASVPASIATLSGSGVPALSALTFGMPTGTTYAPTTTYTGGASATQVSSTIATWSYTLSAWPAMDKTPPTDSDEVKEWMKELDGHDIPDLEPTVDGTCASDPNNVADAESRGWWSCGHYTRDTDITVCPDQYTWGVTFDDGPSPYSGKLLPYLAENDITSTFFVVGSRVIEYPDLLREEFMAGHEIAVHTWSHPHMTTKTNEELVAELGWTRQAIKEVLGYTPTLMRPPYGDIDDRVRAISLAMGMVPVIWTVANNVAFDTNDWNVAGGTKTGEQCVETFSELIGNATSIDSGFIVLEHDLFELTVDLAIGYNLPAALKHDPPFKLEAVGKCNNIPTSNLYRETNQNSSFPYSGSSSNGTSSSGSSSSSAGDKGGSDGAAAVGVPIVLVGAAALAASLMAL